MVKKHYRIRLYLSLVFQKDIDESQDAEDDRVCYREMMAQFNWFALSLFVVGFVQDPITHKCFRLPGNAKWTIYIEVRECVAVFSLRRSVLFYYFED